MHTSFFMPHTFCLIRNTSLNPFVRSLTPSSRQHIFSLRVYTTLYRYHNTLFSFHHIHVFTHLYMFSCSQKFTYFHVYKSTTSHLHSVSSRQSTSSRQCAFCGDGINANARCSQHLFLCISLQHSLVGLSNFSFILFSPSTFFALLFLLLLLTSLPFNITFITNLFSFSYPLLPLCSYSLSFFSR